MKYVKSTLISNYSKVFRQFMKDCQVSSFTAYIDNGQIKILGGNASILEDNWINEGTYESKYFERMIRIASGKVKLNIRRFNLPEGVKVLKNEYGVYFTKSVYMQKSSF